jgi:hypothetical protein
VLSRVVNKVGRVPRDWTDRTDLFGWYGDGHFIGDQYTKCPELRFTRENSHSNASELNSRQGRITGVENDATIEEARCAESSADQLRRRIDLPAYTPDIEIHSGCW